MSRLTIALVAIIAVLAGGLATSLYSRAEPGLDEAGVRAIVTDVLAETDKPVSVAGIDAATLHPMIESYLMANPRILERVSNALQAEVRKDEIMQSRAAIAAMQDQIYNNPNEIVLGNPQGDVTLVEMFDYNCSYCRSAMPDMAKLLDTDPNLKIILKEFPILSQESVEVARIALAAHQAGIDYWTFHTTLFTARGKVTKDTALDAAEAQGLSRVSLELDAQSDDINAIIQRSYEIAQAIGTTGTPTYLIGDEVIPGAIGIESLRDRIANMRACGSTVCDG